MYYIVLVNTKRENYEDLEHEVLKIHLIIKIALYATHIGQGCHQR